jgi:hypothetical protein
VPPFDRAVFQQLPKLAGFRFASPHHGATEPRSYHAI